uniref:Eukaryotic translation initiation factor 3 30 kDa subunit n=1 Tax=Ascaris lumbricoides TaxID=6252 RepID=A0A0M3HLH6_ASCLU
MGFDPDPVKKWKEAQKRKELEATGEVIPDEDEEIESENEENEEASTPQGKDLERKLSDYDYLVGMAIMKLSTEEKDKLLRESEAKMEELKVISCATVIFRNLL